MQFIAKVKFIVLCSLGLALLLCSTARAGANQSLERNQADKQTVLTVQAQRALPSGEGALVTARLTTAEGTPVADADVVLLSSVTPAQHGQTDSAGIANFRLAPANTLPGYHLKVVFGGKPGYHATIALLTLDAQTPIANAITSQTMPITAVNDAPLPSTQVSSAPTQTTATATVDHLAAHDGNAKDESPTVLTVQPEIRARPGEEPIVIALLTTALGEPLANAEVMLFVETTPALRVHTNLNGISTFHLAPGLSEGDHDLKIVFAGKDAYQAALTMTTLHYHTAAPAITSNESQRTTAQANSTQTKNAPIAAESTNQGSTKGNRVPAGAVAVARVPTGKEASAAQSAPVILPVLPPTAQNGQPSALATQGLALITTLMTTLGRLFNRYPHSQQTLAIGALAALGFVLPATYVARQRQMVKPIARSATPLVTPGAAGEAWWQALSLPLPVWYAIRISSIGIALGLAIVLFVRPTLGLYLFWRVFIPMVPLLFFIAPGLWRNICPMATLNQTPRLFNFTRALTLPTWMQRHGYLISISLFLILVSSRKVIFNQNGPALAVLILCALSAAFVMGNFFKGKSGWCSSICPLLPIQRIYGQTPFVTVTHAHCQPCLGCTKNCYDLSPQNAYLADLYDEDAQHVNYRKLFVGLFPGFIWAFYTLPNPPAIPIWAMYSYFALYCLASLITFLLVSTLVRVSSNKITVLYGALALNLYYWFNAPTLGALVGTPAPDWFVWPLRTLVLGLTLFWIYRTYRKEPAFVTQMVAASSIVSASNIALTMPRPSQMVAASHKPVVTIEPEGKRIVVEKNRTLLEIIESNNLPIEAGCRMGLCGADPVCIHAGMDKLSKIGNEERATLERLALAPNTRMACMARVRGEVKIGLKPERPQIYVSSVVAGFKYDKAVQKVVIVGNGIAGVTAADHIRRRHPHCEIHLIGRERHHLYNRMGITRLIYGRSAMQGLYLLPDKWYDDFNITCWLNTQVTEIDGQARQVTLGTGETLGYDRLILTTGSQSYVPPIAGHDLPGVFVLRTAEDAMAIRAFVQAQGCRQAVIAGGGLLGLEAAYGLHKLGVEVTVLERSNSLLRRQLDARGGQFLCEYLTAMGIHIVMQAEVTAVQDGLPAVQRVQQVMLNNGASLPCDLLLVTAGIRAELELARSLGLTVKQGVVVDAAMRTSDPVVFAAGDVAEYAGKVYGLWPVAVSQAEVAANNAVAAPGAAEATYSETPPVTMLKVVGIDLTSMGRIETAGDQDIVIALEESAEHRYRKLIIAEGKIVGAILLGYPLEAPGVTAAVRQQFDIMPHLASLQAGDWEVLRALA